MHHSHRLAAVVVLLLPAALARAQSATPRPELAVPNANPQQELAGAPETGLGTTYGGDIDTKVQVDGRFTPGRPGFAEIYAKSIANAYINVGDAFSVRAEGTYERFRNQSGTTAFNSQGLYLSQLYASYTVGPVTAYAGKIHPRFSIGYDLVPGIYDTFANDYEQKERLGAGVVVLVFPAFGRHTLSAELYTRDTSVLGRALFSNANGDDPAVLRAGRPRMQLGGAGNTGTLNNFDVVADGTAIPGIERLRYHLGVSHQSVAQPGERAEDGVTAALTTTVKLTPRIEMIPFVEVAHLANYGGTAREQRDILVTALEFDYRRYALSFTAAPRRVSAPGTRRWDLQYGATLSYTIMPRLVVSAGYLRTRDTGLVENTVGTALDYVVRF